MFAYIYAVKYCEIFFRLGQLTVNGRHFSNISVVNSFSPSNGYLNQDITYYKYYTVRVAVTVDFSSL